MCSVSLPAEDGTVSITADHLPPVQPSLGQACQPTPSPGYGAPSPLGYSPMTPGSHSDSPFTRPTPGASLDISGQTDWYSPNIEVTIEDTQEGPGLQGQSGVSCGVKPGINSVFKCLKPAKNKHT